MKRAPAWVGVSSSLSVLGQRSQQLVFAVRGEAGRPWPVQALFAFPGQQVGEEGFARTVVQTGRDG